MIGRLLPVADAEKKGAVAAAEERRGEARRRARADLAQRRLAVLAHGGEVEAAQPRLGGVAAAREQPALAAAPVDGELIQLIAVEHAAFGQGDEVEDLVGLRGCPPEGDLGGEVGDAVAEVGERQVLEDEVDEAAVGGRPAGADGGSRSADRAAGVSSPA